MLEADEGSSQAGGVNQKPYDMRADKKGGEAV